jgi:hypothetical protein
MGVAQDGAAPRRARTLPVMATIRLTLEIERGAEPITGRLTGPRGRQREFCGWTALATTIDSAITASSGPAQGTQEASTT